MISRRKAIGLMAAAGAAPVIPKQIFSKNKETETRFKFCLNTSTISGNNAGIQKYIKAAGEAGYDGIEIWVRDVEAYLSSGGSTSDLNKMIRDHGLQAENAIGFAPWLAEGGDGFKQMEKEMNMLAEVGCKRIAAPAAGVKKALDLFEAGKKFKKLLDLGRKTGVMPQLEFWGASDYLWHMGQILMISAVADDPEVKILPDVYHMFRGGSGYDTLKMLNGSMIDIFHFNDFPADKSRKDQTDADRVYPGDGAAPWKKIISYLDKMGGEKILSLELFNREYWKEDELAVAKKGLSKMKNVVGNYRPQTTVDRLRAKFY
jgi:2-keto-myo-inositol isomerase